MRAEKALSLNSDESRSTTSLMDKSSRVQICCCVSSFGDRNERIDDDIFVSRPHFIGNSILLCGKRATRFPYHCMIGPDWFCMLIAYIYYYLRFSSSPTWALLLLFGWLPLLLSLEYQQYGKKLCASFIWKTVCEWEFLLVDWLLVVCLFVCCLFVYSPVHFPLLHALIQE